MPSSLLNGYVALYGEDDAFRHIRLPMFNSGVLAARADSPLWELWREALASVRQPMAEMPGNIFTDQVPLHQLIASERLSVHPLMAVNNWLVNYALPCANMKRKRLMTSFYPYEELNIVHLSGGTKDKKFRMADNNIETTFRYRDIKELFY